MTSKRVVLYARLSTSSDESVSIERQLEAGRDYCRAKGWEVIGEHVDDGVSASANAPEHRRGWQALLNRPRGSFDVVLIWKVDRLARKVIDFLHADEALQAKGAAVASVSDPIDMSTATGRAFATMLAVFAEMEAEAIRARVKAARRALVKAGRVPGGAAPFGYYNAPNPDGPGKVVAKDPDTIGFVTQAAARVLRGDSMNSVAAYLDEVAPRTGRKNSAAYWTITVTKRMLQNPILAGMTAHNPGNTGKQRGTEVLRDETGMPIIREDLAILSIEEHRALTARLAVSEPYTTPNPSYLAGLVWCGHCNRRMYRNAKSMNGKKVRVFQCQGKEGCGQQVTNLESIVEKTFLDRFGSLPMMRLERRGSDRDLAEVHHQISDTLARMSEDGADDDALLERLQALKSLRSKAPEPDRFEPILDQTVAEWWQTDRREALLSYFTGVRLTRGKGGRNFDPTRLTLIETRRIRIDPTVVPMDDPDAIAAAIRESKRSPEET
ncbi:recombinase family protein [Geodermatophilus sabuli]|uniref:Recombinase family protein n=1 Tax=Geodermatophilus sabuli TaxID=1564158 RepID=A0A7K3W504_9ACTN|nr:recombinase family protein [Geodermatophilus sabuli]NEK59902.1 recombinase family protein [Geodermatophilus sabuli]